LAKVIFLPVTAGTNLSECRDNRHLRAIPANAPMEIAPNGRKRHKSEDSDRFGELLVFWADWDETNRIAAPQLGDVEPVT